MNLNKRTKVEKKVLKNVWTLIESFIAAVSLATLLPQKSFVEWHGALFTVWPQSVTLYFDVYCKCTIYTVVNKTPKKYIYYVHDDELQIQTTKPPMVYDVML